MTHHLGFNRRRALVFSAWHSTRSTSILALLLATHLSVGLAAAVPSPQAEGTRAAPERRGRDRVVRFAGVLAIAAASVLPPGVTAAPYEWVPGTQCTALRNVAGIKNTTKVESTTTVFDWTKLHQDKVAAPFPNTLAANPSAAAHAFLPGDDMNIPNANVVLSEGGAEILRQANAHRKGGGSGALPKTVSVVNEAANYAALIPMESLRACLAGDSSAGHVDVVVVSAPAARKSAGGAPPPDVENVDLVVKFKSPGPEIWYPGPTARQVHYARTGKLLPAAVRGKESPEGDRTVHLSDRKRPGVDYQWHGTQPGYGWGPGNWAGVNEQHIPGISIVNPDGSQASPSAIAEMNAWGGSTLGCKSSRNRDIVRIADMVQVGDPVLVRPKGASFVFEANASGESAALHLHVARPNPVFGDDHRPAAKQKVLAALAARLKVDGKGDISNTLREEVEKAFESQRGTAIRILIEQ